eukprot:SAG11_NODE_4585_length_1843_cov_1.861812_1_plen_46_part_10
MGTAVFSTSIMYELVESVRCSFVSLTVYMSQLCQKPTSGPKPRKKF